MMETEQDARMGAEVAPVITNRLSRLMGERRIRIQDVADGTGLAYSAVHALYHDKAKRLDISTLNKICNYLNVPVGDIFEWTPEGEGK
jgi:putative transcriptional regulator